MDKLKKLGLTALAGSMVATSVAAGEFGVTGGMAWSWDSNDSDESGNPMSMTNDVLFSASGETDQGWTATVAIELDGGTSDDESLTLDFGDGGVDSWQFFNGDINFPDPAQPWSAGPRDNSFTFTLEPGFRLPDFIAVKSGDANGNAIVD